MPWPPSVNRIWRAVGGRVILSLVARQYGKSAAKWLPVGRVRAPMRGRLAVWLTMCPPVKLQRGGNAWDIANREKCLCDALTKQRIWLDDSQIDMMVIQRGAPSAAGHVDVTIHTIEPEAGLL
jgi:crossover junction endodeoxyribonuclease RusA